MNLCWINVDTIKLSHSESSGFLVKMAESQELAKYISSEVLSTLSEKEINEIDEHLSMLAEISIDSFLLFKSKNFIPGPYKSSEKILSPIQFYKTESIRTLSE